MICPECGTRLPKNTIKCHFCGSDVTPAKLTNFVDKFIALFTLIAFCITISLFFFTISDGGNLDIGGRVLVGTILGLLFTYLYWKISPCMIKRWIDPKIE
jgi:hypothetical protein